MMKVMFVCHGNICRSPMAEYVFREMVKKRGIGDTFMVSSSATSTEEIGNPVHRGTRDKLKEQGISVENKRSERLVKKDYLDYDYLIGMDQMNIKNMNRLVGQDYQHKIHRLLDFTQNPGDIADPWYTGNFDKTYDDVCRGCEALLERILNENRFL